MPISPTDVKNLRDMTGAGMMDAKKALEEASGDVEQAMDLLRKKGMASAQKRSARDARCGLVSDYVHGGRIGVLVEVNCETDFVARTEDFQQFAHDIAMHIAAAGPEYLNPEAVPGDVLDREKAIYAGEMEGQNKPAEIIEKIVTGKLEKYYENVCLTKQPFVKDPDKTIEQLTTEIIAKVGENIVIRRYSRMELGTNS
jgi:elongation factor Ts